MTRPKTESPATAFSVALLKQFVQLGVRDVVLGPGSRSQALALAAAEFERAGLVRLRVRIDERVGGFLALGIAVETSRPVLIITTSGTAVANLHPAVLEAHHSGVPLIVITADRPESLRGVGSNQTTDQPGIFGTAVQRTWDVGAPTGQPGEVDAAAQLARDAVAFGSGPVHLNLAFAEPLSSPFTLPEGLAAAMHPTQHSWVGAGVAESQSDSLSSSAPLELLVTANFGDRVSRVIVFGHPTLSREVPALIERDGVETVVVRHPSADDFNPGRRVTTFADAVIVTGEPDARSWAGRWVAASRALIEDVDDAPDAAADTGAHAKAELAAVRAPVTRRTLVEAVWRSTWPHDRLVLGASRLIREADKVLVGKRIPVHSNRGLAGIDGTISTALGIALASQAEGSGGTTRVLVGDLTFLHDVGALLFGLGEPRPRIQVIVGNDGGGTIFDGLEVGRQGGPAFDRVLLTPQEVSIAKLAEAYGWDYVRVDTRGGLDQALTASTGPVIVEVPLPRE